MLEEYKDILTINDLCNIMHIGKTSAYKLIKENKVPCVKVGRNIRIPKKLLIMYILNEDKVCYNESTQHAIGLKREVN